MSGLGSNECEKHFSEHLDGSDDDFVADSEFVHRCVVFHDNPSFVYVLLFGIWLYYTTKRRNNTLIYYDISNPK